MAIQEYALGLACLVNAFLFFGLEVSLSTPDVEDEDDEGGAAGAPSLPPSS